MRIMLLFSKSSDVARAYNKTIDSSSSSSRFVLELYSGFTHSNVGFSSRINVSKIANHQR